MNQGCHKPFYTKKYGGFPLSIYAEWKVAYAETFCLEAFMRLVSQSFFSRRPAWRKSLNSLLHTCLHENYHPWRRKVKVLTFFAVFACPSQWLRSCRRQGRARWMYTYSKQNWVCQNLCKIYFFGICQDWILLIYRCLIGLTPPPRSLNKCRPRFTGTTTFFAGVDVEIRWNSQSRCRRDVMMPA